MVLEPKKEISLGVLVKTAWKFRRHCFLIGLSIVLLINIGYLFTAKRYTAVATIMNIGDERVGGNNLFQVVGLVKSLNEGFFKFMAIVKSRTFQEQVVKNLGPEFFAPAKGWKGAPDGLKDYALGQLGRSIDLRVNPDQTNVLNVMVTYPDPEKAPILVNHILVDLQNYISQNSLTRAKRLRNYIEENIIETKAAIFETAKAMSIFYNKNAVSAQKAMVENPLQKEALKLRSLSLDEITKDPLLKGTAGELSLKKKELIQRLEAIKEIPEQSYFDYLQEEYSILKEINVTLRQQHELAKLEAVKQEPAFQILDMAQGASLAGAGKRQILTTSLVIAFLAVFTYVLYRCFYTPAMPRAIFDFFKEEALRPS